MHEAAGLFVSYRGAIWVPEVIPQVAYTQPCDACAAPCVSACPVGAFAAGGYDVAACKGHVSSPQGVACKTTGCAARRACPVGANRRLPVQSAFHMEAFQ